MILFPGLTVQYFRGSGGQQTFCSSIERWLKEYQFCNIAVVRIRTTALAAKFLRCQNAGEKKTAASWLHQLAGEDQICSEEGNAFHRSLRSERARSQQSWLYSKRATGRAARRAGVERRGLAFQDIRDIFLGRATLSGHVTRISMRKDDVFRV